MIMAIDLHTALLAQSPFLSGWAIAGYTVLAAVLLSLAFFKKYYIVVGPDKAIVKSGMGGLDVTTAGGKFIIPLFHRYEFMDLTLKSFETLICLYLADLVISIMIDLKVFTVSYL